MADFAILDEIDDPQVADQMTEALMEELRENGAGAFAASAPEWFRPGDSEVASALGDGDASKGRMGLISDARTKDLVTIYSTIDGEPRHINTYMLAKTIRKKRADGRPAFTMKPVVQYLPGTLKCMLHPESDLRELCDRIGLRHRSCSMDNIRTKLDQRLHMEHRHRQEWAAIAEYQAELEKEEEREFRRALLSGQIAQPASPAKGKAS